MTRKSIFALTLLAVGAGTVPCIAQSTPTGVEPAPKTATLDMFASIDADDTQVLRTGLTLDWAHASEDQYQGVRVERAWFKPLGRQTTAFERVYARYADTSGGWAWKAQVGTDGNTLLGSVNVADTSRWRKELFVERDILETPRGVKEGLYYTFAGAAFDVPLSERDTASVVLGAQEFTGKNVRLHLRGNYIHVLEPQVGLSAQLRGRYFHSTRPGEFDYFSPRWYAEVLPILQIRRYSQGWRYLLAGGYGLQRDAASEWRASRYLNAQVSSSTYHGFEVKAGVLYSNTPVATGEVYDYLQATLALTKRF